MSTLRLHNSRTESVIIQSFIILPTPRVFILFSCASFAFFISFNSQGVHRNTMKSQGTMSCNRPHSLKVFPFSYCFFLCVQSSLISLCIIKLQQHCWRSVSFQTLQFRTQIMGVKVHRGVFTDHFLCVQCKPLLTQEKPGI